MPTQKRNQKLVDEVNARMADKQLEKKPLPRNARRDTRALLVAAAAEEFNTHGFHGTDTNQIARAAGYSPASFYKHFEDKRAIFHAAYQEWVTVEWGALGQILAKQAPASRVAADVVATVLALHRRWRVFRASLRALAAIDPAVREFRRGQLRRQLELIAELRSRQAHGARSKITLEDDAFLLLTMERVCDALADGEAEAVGLSAKRLTARLVERLAEQLG